MSAATSGSKAPNKTAAEKKKLMFLLGLGLVGLLLWGRVLIQRVPRTAVAAPTAQASNTNPSAASSVATVADGTSEERKVVNVNLPDKLPRDLFALDASRYTRVKDDTDIRPPEKSVPQPSDVTPRVTVGTSGLVLQATILGQHPCALINGQVVLPGQRIKGYVLRKVLPQRVIVEMNGVEITLTK